MATRDYKSGKRDLATTDRVLSSDEYDQPEFPYKTVVGQQLYTIPRRWFHAILEILDLPIPSYSAPLAVHGEISTTLKSLPPRNC